MTCAPIQHDTPFPGPAENIPPQTRLFSRIDAKARLFKARVIDANRPRPDFAALPKPYRHQPHAEQKQPQLSAKEAMTRRAQRLIETFAPAAVVVDESFDVVHFAGRTGRYLQPSPGTATLNLFNIVDAA